MSFLDYLPGTYIATGEGVGEPPKFVLPPQKSNKQILTVITGASEILLDFIYVNYVYIHTHTYQCHIVTVTAVRNFVEGQSEK